LTQPAQTCTYSEQTLDFVGFKIKCPFSIPAYCNHLTPAPVACINNCSNAGTCTEDGQCMCAGLRTGADCSVYPTCPIIPSDILLKNYPNGISECIRLGDPCTDDPDFPYVQQVTDYTCGFMIFPFYGQSTGPSRLLASAGRAAGSEQVGKQQSEDSYSQQASQ